MGWPPSERIALTSLSLLRFPVTNTGAQNNRSAPKRFVFTLLTEPFCHDDVWVSLNDFFNSKHDSSHSESVGVECADEVR